MAGSIVGSTDEMRRALEAALLQRDALKAAGDALVWELSHPTRHGKRFMDAIVAYRRISDEIGDEAGGPNPSEELPSIEGQTAGDTTAGGSHHGE